MDMRYPPPTAKGKVFMQLFNRCHKNNNPVTNLKYQKLLYYLHGWAMVLEKINLFERDAFQAWKQGPVHVEEYHRYKGYKSERIGVYFPKVTEENFLVSLIVDHYGKLGSFRLAEMTHQEPPWLENWDGTRYRTIPDAEISEYFSSKEILENPIHGELLEDYLHRKDSVPWEEIADFSVGEVPQEEWDTIKKEFGFLE